MVEREQVNYVHNVTSNGTVDLVENESNVKVLSHSVDHGVLSGLNRSSNSQYSTTSNHMSVYSSFNCFNDFPSSIAEYVNDTFKKQFELGHADIYAKDDEKIDTEKLPILVDVRVACSLSQDCKAYFKFDKQYGTETNNERTMIIDNMFNCCSVDEVNTTNVICEDAKSMVKKSLVRHSKHPTLLVSLKKNGYCNFNLIARSIQVKKCL